jgi:DNA (cytosine-5)-methyltransferase 1
LAIGRVPFRRVQIGKNVDYTQEQRVISFCTGYAGLELGLHRVIPNLRTVAYVEREAYAAANLVAKIEEGYLDAAPVWTDVKTFPARKFRGRIHGITAGYPCQPFSLAGKRAGTKDPRHLWPHIRRHVAAVEPLWCFFENVEGHVTLGYAEVYRDLRALGYRVEAGLFTAAEVGAPHQRKRLFILAYRDSERFNWQSIPIQSGQSQQASIETCWCSTELEYPACQRPQGIYEQGQGLRESDAPGTVGNSANVHVQRQQSEFCNSQRWEIAHGQIGLPSRTRWPARPGQEQYEWEEPRTIKSGVGCAVDGFNSYVDELRLLGNGVVPEQAAKAFRELWGK